MIDMSGKDPYSWYPNIFTSNIDNINYTVYFIEKLKSMGYTEKQIREIFRNNSEVKNNDRT